MVGMEANIEISFSVTAIFAEKVFAFLIPKIKKVLSLFFSLRRTQHILKSQGIMKYGNCYPSGETDRRCSSF